MFKRDYFSPFTATKKQATTLRAEIIKPIAKVKGTSGYIIHIDGAPSALSNPAKRCVLNSLNISLEIGWRS